MDYRLNRKLFAKCGRLKRDSIEFVKQIDVVDSTSHRLWLDGALMKRTNPNGALHSVYKHAKETKTKKCLL